jgi:small subunit ribosomal protein S8
MGGSHFLYYIKKRMIIDHIGDLLTRIRNGLLAGLESIVVTKTKINGRIAQILLEEGYIRGYTEKEGAMTLYLKRCNDQPMGFATVSFRSGQGRRSSVYLKCSNIPSLSYGTLILTTNRGILSHRLCKDLNIGGEVLCYIGMGKGAGS